MPILHQYFFFGSQGLFLFPLVSVVLMDASYFMGMWFYTTQFPESRYPQRFDFWVSAI